MKQIALLMLTVAAGLTLGCSSPEQAPAPTAHEATTEETRKIALAFLDDYLIKRNMDAYATYADPDYIQHNPLMENGVAGQRAYFAKVAGGDAQKDPRQQRHVTDLLLVDGDTFALMHHSVPPQGATRLFVDLWRVKDGKIVEHWDVIQEIPDGIPHNNGMACGNLETWDAVVNYQDSISKPTCGHPDPKADRAASIKAFQDYVADMAKDVPAAIQHWLSDDYRQHSPIIADGKQGAIDYLRKEWGDRAAVKPVLGPQRIVAEGDLVLVHYIRTDPAEDRHTAQVDIFRITNGKVSEHWDVKQRVPPTTASGNPMW